jgi:hypothetical protein
MPPYSPLSNEAARQAPPSAPGSTAPAPTYSSLSNEPAQTSLFEAPSDLPASVGKFDFSWASDVFHHQDQRDKTEDIDFKWNVSQNSVTIPPVAAVAAAADQQAGAAAARQREEKSESIFHDDTFHLRTSAQEDARFAELKKNEEFQELLDQEFEKIKDRQAEIDAERSRIDEKIMSPPEPTPSVLVTGENARIAAEERIQEYLRRADREMREAMKLQAALKQQDIDAMEQESASAVEPESSGSPEPAIEAGYSPVPAPIPESAPAVEPESTGSPVSEPEVSGNFDPYESFGSNTFAAPGDSDQDTNVKAFGFKHKEGDVVWEREREDYDPEVSAIKEDKDAGQTASYLKGRPVDDVAETFVPDPVVAPEPVAAPEPTAAFEPVAKPEPTAAFEPVVAPEPTAAFQPVATPEPVAAPEPTATFEPVATPEPTAAFEPVAAPAPASAPEPAAAPANADGRDASPSIFITDFVNPFAADAVSAAPVSEPAPVPVSELVPEIVTGPISEPVVEPVAEPSAEPTAEPVTEPVAKAETVRSEESEGGIFDTGFANPFAFDAPLQQDTTPPTPAPEIAPDTVSPYKPSASFTFVPAVAPESDLAAVPESTSTATPESGLAAMPESEPATASDFVSTATPLYEPAATTESAQPIALEPIAVSEPTIAPGPSAAQEQPPTPIFAAPEPTIAAGPTAAPETATTPEPIATPEPTAAPGQPTTTESTISPAPATAPEQSGIFAYEPIPGQSVPQSEPQTGPEQGAAQSAGSQAGTGQGTAQIAEPPIKPAPVTGAAPTSVSGRRHAPDIINKPVVFPFDEAPEKAASGKIEPAKPVADVFTVPEHKTPEAHKPVAEVPETPAPAPVGSSSATPAAAAAGTPAATETAASAGLPSATPAAAGTAESATKKKGAAFKSGAANRSRPNKGIVVLVDALIVIVVILAACLAIKILAPGTGAAELINKGASRFMEITGIAGGESNAAETDADVSSSLDEGYVMPISDGDTLVGSQLYNNYNINEVRYDPGASWEEGVQYSIEGATAAKPIADDHWTDGPQGPLLYDESAVAAIIRFDSGLVDYINQGNTEFLNTVVVGSSAEKKLAGYVASVSQLSFDSLGIGNIRKNGDDLYVWTNETVTETTGGAPVQRTAKRLYMLAPDVDTYKVSDYEDIG